MDQQYSQLEGTKYCDSCSMYLDNNTAYNKHVEKLKQGNNVKLNNGEIIKNRLKFDCVTCKTSLSQNSVEQHFVTKMYLDNVGVKIRIILYPRILQVIVIYVTLDMTIKRNTLNQNNIMKILKRKNLLMKSGEIKLRS